MQPARRERPRRTFTPLYDDILFNTDLSLRAAVLMCFLLRRGASSGRIFPSLQSMANAMKSSKKSAQRALDELVASGFVEKIQRFAGNSQIRNEYRVLYDPSDTGGQNDHGVWSNCPPEETTEENRDYERLARKATPARPLSLSPIAQALFTHHRLLHPEAPPPSTRIAADMMMAASRNGMDEQQAVEEFTVFATYRLAGLKDEYLPESYRWWVVAWTNHLVGVRTSLGTFRPELAEPIVPIEYDDSAIN